jgi:hypothetical protein
MQGLAVQLQLLGLWVSGPLVCDQQAQHSKQKVIS